MGILKYYSPYIENSIKIKIHYEKEKKLFPDDKINKIIDRFKKFTFNLDKIDGTNLENKKKFEEINMESYDNGDYYLTLFYNGLLKDMNNLFEDCTSFIEIDLSNFNTYNVKKMNNMFKKCDNLTKIIFSKVYTSKVEEMESIFDGCTSLKEINFSNFNGSKLINTNNMFGQLKVQLYKKNEKNNINGITNVITNDKKIKGIINNSEIRRDSTINNLMNNNQNENNIVSIPNNQIAEQGNNDTNTLNEGNIERIDIRTKKEENNDVFDKKETDEQVKKKLILLGH